MTGRTKEQQEHLAAFYCAENLTNTENHDSADLRFQLTVESYKTGASTWNFTRGIVKHFVTQEVIAVVDRNYSSFWFSWMLGVKGKDYLLCGENYQGLTIIELQTGQRVDWLPKEAEQGWGFCHYDALSHPDKPILAVRGCIWGAGEDILVYDTTNILSLPWPKIGEAYDAEEVESLLEVRDTELVVERMATVCKATGRSEKEWTEEEREEWLNGDDDLYFERAEQRILPWKRTDNVVG